MKRLVALLTMFLVVLPTGALAHHRSERALYVWFEGTCELSRPADAEVTYSGITRVQGPQRRVRRVGVTWRSYVRMHPDGELEPGARWSLVEVLRHWSGSGYIGSIWGPESGSQNDYDARLVATARWHLKNGTVIRHRRLLAEWIYPLEDQSQVCYGYQA
jgi:hypothetical protein